ncbi:MAG: HAMP domain-containing histidine kinase [Eubacterium sp.]|nr:HAMP domain-containing histidine kinase [Eubacterium sp.]
MPEHQINSIRKKFIIISTLSFCAVMLLMGGFVYLFSTITIRNEARHIMNRIVDNDGEIPLLSEEEAEQGEEAYYFEGKEDDIDWSLRGIFGLDSFFGESPDYFYTTRYFSVLFDEENEVEEVKASHIAYIDEEEAEEYARAALNSFRDFGNLGRYYYCVAERNNGGKIVIYLDRTTQVAFAHRIQFAVLLLLGFGTLLAFFLMRFFSTDVVKAEIDNAERQKQFITNASHELKTPLAVISANTEMQEMICGESEWTQSTMRQVERMNGLISNLVRIVRAQEVDSGELVEQNIAPFVRETAESFSAVAAGDGKQLEMEIEDPVILRSVESKIRQLVSLLTDNAVKYCDAGGTIRVGLSRSGKAAVLAVSNTYAAGESVDYSRFFERFYREDEARTIAEEETPDHRKNGYGIGLSIVESLLQSIRGTIQVSWKNGEITFTCRLPQIK